MMQISPTLITIGGLLLVGVVLYFLGPPLLTFFTQKMEASPDIVPYDPALTAPPRSTERFFAKCDRGLASCGFRRVTSVLLPNPMPNVYSVLDLFVHDRNRDAAMVIAIFGDSGGGPPLEARYVEFITEFVDHEYEMVVTNNNLEVGAFPDRPEAPTFRLPQVHDVVRLYDAHQSLAERYGRSARRHQTVFDRFGGDVSEYLKTCVLFESYQRQVETGYLRFDRGRDCFVPTFVGAYKMTWRLLWPMKQMIQSRYQSEGLRLEAELLDDDDWGDEDDY